MADLLVSGMAELRRAFEQLPAKLVKNSIRTGLRKGANLVKQQAQANFNAGQGPSDLSTALRKSIRVAARRGTATRVVFNVVAGELTSAQKKKFGEESAFYALMVERGHINRKLGQALRGSKSGVKAARNASTSNTPAHPFMRPAIDSKAQAAIDLMIATIRTNLPQDVK